MKKENCDKCGVCCELFMINLSKQEYNSGKFKTIFQDFGELEFKLAKECGANFLAKKKEGSCVYLKNNLCSIHESRPKVCREFFCGSEEVKFAKMEELINERKTIV